LDGRFAEDFAKRGLRPALGRLNEIGQLDVKHTFAGSNLTPYHGIPVLLPENDRDGYEQDKQPSSDESFHGEV
jgi:hypothetical protein